MCFASLVFVIHEAANDDVNFTEEGGATYSVAYFGLSKKIESFRQYLKYPSGASGDTTTHGLTTEDRDEVEDEVSQGYLRGYLRPAIWMKKFS